MPTPIGNLGDISARCLDILEAGEIIICEDTRVGKSLLNLLNISLKNKEFYCLNSHNFDTFIANFDEQNFNEKCCIYMSDAGMPCISDPGAELVEFAQNSRIPYEVLPGANALLLAVAASALVSKEFNFLGFLPNTGHQRQVELERALNSRIPTVIYESPKRILDLIEKIAGLEAERKIFAIKEATKKFEAKFFGTAKGVAAVLKNANLNGEWALVISAKASPSGVGISRDDILELDIAPKIKAKLLAKLTGQNAKKIYENLTK